MLQAGLSLKNSYQLNKISYGVHSKVIFNSQTRGVYEDGAWRF